MEYREIETEAAAFESPLANPPKMNPLARLAPRSVMLRKAQEQLPTIRKMMGGQSRDITRRPVVMEDTLLPGGEEPLRVRVYVPKEPKSGRPCVLFLHGGGWIGGSLPAVEEFCKAVADRADALVASVDYRLAPEHPFPAGLDDSQAALAWLSENAGNWGGNGADITVMGDSAGGNYAAVLCLQNREGGVPIAGQVLLYPAVRLSAEDVPGDAKVEGELMMHLIIDWYLDSDPDAANSWRVSPTLAESFAGLPPLLMALAEHDGLTPDAKAYAQKLSDAGVPVTCLLYKNTGHAFIDNTGYAPQAEHLLGEVATFMARQDNTSPI